MSEEEIKHFKAMLRQGSLRHMNILLDDKFQKELLNIIKDYERLQQENTQLKQQIDKANNELITLIQIIMEQPSKNVEEDNYLLSRLESISNILVGGNND